MQKENIQSDEKEKGKAWKETRVTARALRVRCVLNAGQQKTRTVTISPEL